MSRVAVASWRAGWQKQAGEQGGSSKLVSRVAVASWRGSSHSCLQKRGWWAERIGMEEKRGWEDWEVGENY